MTEQKKVAISERALMARINRKLAKEGQKLCKCREGSRAMSNLGTYHVIDTYKNAVIDWGIEDLEKWTKDHDLQVLAPWEASIRDMPIEALVDSGETVSMHDLGLDGFDMNTEEGRRAFKARCKVVQNEIALTEEISARIKKLLKSME